MLYIPKCACKWLSVYTDAVGTGRVRERERELSMNNPSNRLLDLDAAQINLRAEKTTDVIHLGRGSLPCANNSKRANIVKQLM